VTAYDDPWPDDDQADDTDDPHAGCHQPHHGPDGYQDCDGRPI
jgi:hypothetical protein